MGISYKQKPNLSEEIISAAIKVFSEKGYDATNMTDIADALSKNRTSLYYYHKGKKEIYIQAVRNHIATKREIYTELAAENDEIFTWLHKHIKYAFSNKSDQVLFSGFKYSIFRHLSDLNTETNRYVYALKQRRVIRAIETGELPPDTNVELFLDQIYILSYGIIYVYNNSILSQELKNSPERVDAIINLIIEEMKAVFLRDFSFA